MAATLPTSEREALVLLQEVAIPLLEKHAWELLKGELLVSLNDKVGNLKFAPQKPRPPHGAGLPGPPEWVAALQQEVARLCDAWKAVAGLRDFQPEAIADRYNKLLAKCRAPDFLNSGDFLIDMGGKELMTALEARLRGIGAPPDYTKVLQNDLLDVLTRIYRPGVLYQPDDFQELAAILGQY